MKNLFIKICSVIFILYLLNPLFLSQANDHVDNKEEVLNKIGQLNARYIDLSNDDKAATEKKLILEELTKLHSIRSFYDYTSNFCKVPLEDGQKQKIIKGIQHLIEFEKKHLSGESIYELFKAIKDFKKEIKINPRLKSGRDGEYYSKRFESSDKSLIYKIMVDEKGHIYLFSLSGESLIGEGSGKIITKIARYKTWENFALGKAHDKKEDWFKQETEIFKFLMQLPEENKKVFVQTISTMEKEFIQDIYEMDLRSYFKKSGLEIGRELLLQDPLQNAIDLAKGLKIMHENHLFHGDIKPDNILKEENQLVFADFGLASFPGEEIINNKPFKPVGTPLFIAPERVSTKIVHANWTGEDLDEKVKNEFKSDVVSLALSTYCLVIKCNKSEIPHPSVNACRNNSSISAYLACRRQVISEMWEDPNLSFINILYLQALEPNVEKRIDSQLFYEGLLFYQNQKNDLLNRPNSNVHSIEKTKFMEHIAANPVLKNLRWELRENKEKDQGFDLYFFTKDENNNHLVGKIYSNIENMQKIEEEVKMYQKLGVPLVENIPK